MTEKGKRPAGKMDSCQLLLEKAHIYVLLAEGSVDGERPRRGSLQVQERQACSERECMMQMDGQDCQEVRLAGRSKSAQRKLYALV